MSPSLEWVGDTFENQLLQRKKYIHSVGNVGKVRFIPVANNGYTGMLGQGSDMGFIRCSAAKQPDVSKTTADQAKGNFIPGFSLKLLRDGMASANLVAMIGLSGGPSWNYFATEFTNHILPEDGFIASAGAAKFAGASPDVFTVGISDFAMYTQDGKKVASPVFPFELIFKPTSAIHIMFPDSYQGTYFTDQLASVPADAALYDVYALASPNASQVKIGQLKLTTQMTTSYFGDRYMFFKHQDMRDDIASHPDWDAYVPKAKCPFLAMQESVKSITNLFQ